MGSANATSLLCYYSRRTYWWVSLIDAFSDWPLLAMTANSWELERERERETEREREQTVINSSWILATHSEEKLKDHNYIRTVGYPSGKVLSFYSAVMGSNRSCNVTKIKIKTWAGGKKTDCSQSELIQFSFFNDSNLSEKKIILSFLLAIWREKMTPYNYIESINSKQTKLQLNAWD